jgi:GT2 family glycosyltransferase
MPKLAVLIVNWNVRELLRACLTSVYADLASGGPEAEVWVVDNASQDDSLDMLRADFAQVRLLASPENLGFAGGNNLALRFMGEATPPRYVWLLNPDTEVRPGAVGTLVDFMDRHPRVGVAGARLFYGDGRFQHGNFGFPGLWQILFDLFPLPGRFYESRLNGRYPRSWYARGEPFAVDHPLGAAMMVRWDAIAQAGPFDQEFHMYCEEIDWCMRIKRAGWDIYCVPQAEVVHHEGQSTRQIREHSFVNLWRSRRRLYDKHYGPLKHGLAVRLVRAGMKRQIRLVRQKGRRGELDEPEAASRMRAFRGAMACFD